MNGNFDAFSAATQASGWNNMFSPPPRADNAVLYISPTLGGFKVQAMYARGATGGSAIADQVASNQNIHFGAEYANGPLYVGLNFEEVRNAAARNKARRTAAAVSYSFTDALKAYLAVAKQTVSDGSQDNYLYSTSFLYAFTPAASLALGYTFFQDRATGAGHGNASEAGVLYRYSLSKRTILYGAYSYLSQQGNQHSFYLGGAAVVEAGSHIVSTPGGNINGAQVGIVHLF
jgi:predicted porin